MSLQLKIDELQEALADAGHPLAAEFERALCATADAMAVALATIYGTEHGQASQEGKAFAGICVPFSPAYRGQAFPDALEQFDDGGREDWTEQASDDELPEAPAARYVFEPQADALRDEPGDETRFERCDAWEAEIWAVIDTREGALVSDHPNAFTASETARVLNAVDVATQGKGIA